MCDTLSVSNGAWGCLVCCSRSSYQLPCSVPFLDHKELSAGLFRDGLAEVFRPGAQGPDARVTLLVPTDAHPPARSGGLPPGHGQLSKGRCLAS